MLAEDVPKLMGMIPREEHAFLQLQAQTEKHGASQPSTVFNDQQATPFELGGVEGINAGLGETDWIVTKSRHEYDEVFQQLSPQGGKITGAAAKQEMIKSKLVAKSLFGIGVFNSSPLAKQCARSSMETK